MLPSGVVTLLFTDIEGSTKLWERSPSLMGEALADHNKIVREAIERHNGAVFKTVGDEFCAAFAHPRDALAAAIEVQRGLPDHPWPNDLGAIRVRIALHTGECAERDGDYFGPPVNRVARLLSIAYAEQILVSSSSATLLADALDNDATLRDLGEYRLRSLSRPERAFQVLASGLRSDFPPLQSIDVRPNNLPQQISSFVGRELEMQELGRLTAENRLLTITGPGGIGKTRLALQFTADTIERYSDGAFFVDLSATLNPELVVAKVAAELNLREVPNEPIEETLIAHLRDKRLLLLIDNAEQVLAAVAKIVKATLSRCSGVAVLATSREPLHVAGEQVYRLGPLTEADGGDSMLLFVERARQATPSLALSNADCDDIASLCKKLEGIPLAIELACARLSSMPLRQLASGLTSGLSLKSKDSTEASRHRALRETIAWSYDLLSTEERTVLTRLSIFRGGCSAEAIRSFSQVPADLDDVIESLVDKSLVLLDDAANEARYRLLAVVSEFAGEKLRADGAHDALAREHAAYYSELAATLREPAGQLARFAAVDEDLPNLRAAIEWNAAHEPAAAVRLVADLSPYWRVRGSVAEARAWIALAIDAEGGDKRQRAMLLCLSASFATLQDELDEALGLAHEATTIFRDLDDRQGIAEALFRMGEVEHRKGRLDSAEALYQEAREGFVQSHYPRGEVLCIGNLGMLSRQRGALERASELLEDAMQRANGLAENRLSAEFAMAMGWVRLDLDDLAQSRGLFERAFADRSAAQDRYGVCCARHGLATVALREGDLEQARVEFFATLQTATELHLKDYVARALHGFAALQALNGESELAVKWLGLADRLFRESGRELRDSLAYDMAAQSAHEALDEATRAALREEGARMEVADAVALLAISHPSAPD
ncbi:MAG TPA: adenylate/guanylate cyclase domain-containing protein [Candidatus Cybelea sp.]|nr:adenylate/guanylate cyclase domain-containing protein [Candidatus Cybelea sp.]